MKGKAGTGMEGGTTESSLEIMMWSRRELGVQTGKSCNTVGTSALGYESLF